MAAAATATTTPRLFNILLRLNKAWFVVASSAVVVRPFTLAAKSQRERNCMHRLRPEDLAAHSSGSRGSRPSEPAALWLGQMNQAKNAKSTMICSSECCRHLLDVGPHPFKALVCFDSLTLACPLARSLACLPGCLLAYSRPNCCSGCSASSSTLNGLSSGAHAIRFLEVHSSWIGANFAQTTN